MMHSLKLEEKKICVFYAFRRTSTKMHTTPTSQKAIWSFLLNVSCFWQSWRICLLLQYLISEVQKESKKVREMEAAWVYLPYYCFVDEGYNHCWHFRKTQSQLAHILKWKRRKRRCERKKDERPQRKIKNETHTGEPQVDRVSGTRKKAERKKVDGIDSKMSKW